MKTQHSTSFVQKEMAWAGLDIAKSSFTAAAWGHLAFRERHVATFPRNREGAASLLQWLHERGGEIGRIAMVMETTGVYSEELASWLLELDPRLRIALVNSKKTSHFIKSLDLRNKTDDQDARALADYGQERRPPAWVPRSEEQSRLRDLTRTRTDLVQARVAMKLRLNDHERSAKQAGQALARVVKALDTEIERLDRAIEKLAESDSNLGRQIRRVTSILGVGRITVATVLGEVGDLVRFTRSRELTAFAGVSPRRWESGTSVKGKTHLCRKGSNRIRAALFMAAKSAVRYNPDMVRVYARLTGEGKHHMSAMGAVMRKLLILMRAVAKADRDWQPEKA